jgi:hypothetical protein
MEIGAADVVLARKDGSRDTQAALVVYFINTPTFVAPHLSQGEARRRKIPLMGL